MNIELFGSLLILAGLVYWSSAKTAQEFAHQAVKSRCQHLQLQMLDDYVALQRIRIKRNAQGRLEIIRSYGFEFSSTGNERYYGQIILSARQVQSIQFDAYRMPDLESDY
ncbi:MAG: DUF3301 domain-containing protein [Methylococcaceae bacterium]|nr:DUF3301 domain-containing protein [Methylococcaceae bacterium]